MSSADSAVRLLHHGQAGTSGEGDSPEVEGDSFEALANVFVSRRARMNRNEIVASEAELLRRVAAAVRSDRTPPLPLWLKVVGLSPNDQRVALERFALPTASITALIAFRENELRTAAERAGISEEGRSRLLKTTQSLRTYLLRWQTEQRASEMADHELSWTWSSKQHVESPLEVGNTTPTRLTPHTPPSHPPPNIMTSSWVRSERVAAAAAAAAANSTVTSPLGAEDEGMGTMVSSPAPTTSSSTSLGVSSRAQTLSPPSPLTLGSPSTGGSCASVSLSTGGLAQHRVTGRLSQSASMQFGGSSPRSPAAGVMHSIPHRWHRSNKFRITDAPCQLCMRPLGFGFINSWEKCRSCKMKVHTHCKGRLGETCGIRTDLLQSMLKEIVLATNKEMWNDPSTGAPGQPAPGQPGPSHSVHGARSVPPVMMQSSCRFGPSAFQYPEAVGDSSSSTNSSAPSTPAMPGMHGTSSPYAVSLSAVPLRSGHQKFTFPDALPELPDIVLPDESSPSRLVSSQSSEATMRLRPDDSEGTLAVDSQGSGADSYYSSELSPGSRSSTGAHVWERNRWNMSTIRGASAQSSWSDVTVSLKKIEFGPSPLIGKGRFGHVLKGEYFGEVAVKFLNMEHVEEERRLEEFKTEVASFKNVRHDNIVMFMCYCMERGKLAIVTDLCRGRSLFSMLHGGLAADNRQLEFSLAVHYATQICQGVSYLHTKKILHKDLRSKNIFVENHKVTITDLGLMGARRLTYPRRRHSLLLPSHWLCYQAPEILRTLRGEPGDEELPFSESADVFAFGTVWFELLAMELPYLGEQPHTVVWRAGGGLLPALPAMHSVIREAKDLLLSCWAMDPMDRPSFADVLSLLNGLPKKRITRSPSFPSLRPLDTMFYKEV